ncbi:hypothetical protein, partial [Streptomyces recifensis]|uniref:hypothetical protein n=1 Tax=Streptomyces recifensis TaxID=67355 RepID=UPI001ABEF9C2
MTPSHTHTGPHAGCGDADDLDVEEALALVRPPKSDRTDQVDRADRTGRADRTALSTWSVRSLLG